MCVRCMYMGESSCLCTCTWRSKEDMGVQLYHFLLLRSFETGLLLNLAGKQQGPKILRGKFRYQGKRDCSEGFGQIYGA